MKNPLTDVLKAAVERIDDPVFIAQARHRLKVYGTLKHVVLTTQESSFLVEASTRTVLAEAGTVKVRGIPEFKFGPDQEAEARELTREATELVVEGWPGWGAVFEWLDVMLASDTPQYATSFCNQGHRVKDGVPLGHECYIIPPFLLRLEIAEHPRRYDFWHRWTVSKRKTHRGAN